MTLTAQPNPLDFGLPADTPFFFMPSSHDVAEHLSVVGDISDAAKQFINAVCSMVVVVLPPN